MRGVCPIRKILSMKVYILSIFLLSTLLICAQTPPIIQNNENSNHDHNYNPWKSIQNEENSEGSLLYRYKLCLYMCGNNSFWCPGDKFKLIHPSFFQIKNNTTEAITITVTITVKNPISSGNTYTIETTEKTLSFYSVKPGQIKSQEFYGFSVENIKYTLKSENSGSSTKTNSKLSPGQLEPQYFPEQKKDEIKQNNKPKQSVTPSRSPSSTATIKTEPAKLKPNLTGASVFLKIQGSTQTAMFKNDNTLKLNDKNEVMEGTLVTNIFAYPVHNTTSFNPGSTAFKAGGLTRFNTKGNVLEGILATNFTGRITKATAVPNSKSLSFKSGTKIIFAANEDAEVVEGTILTDAFLKDVNGISKNYKSASTLKFNSIGLVIYEKEKIVTPEAAKQTQKIGRYGYFIILNTRSSFGDNTQYFFISPIKNLSELCGNSKSVNDIYCLRDWYVKYLTTLGYDEEAKYGYAESIIKTNYDELSAKRLKFISELRNQSDVKIVIEK